MSSLVCFVRNSGVEADFRAGLRGNFTAGCFVGSASAALPIRTTRGCCFRVLGVSLEAVIDGVWSLEAENRVNGVYGSLPLIPSIFRPTVNSPNFRPFTPTTARTLKEV